VARPWLLVSHTDISHYRPAHVHFLIDVPGYEPLITHVFPEGAQYLDSDAVFSVKSQLVVEFERCAPGSTPDGRECKVPWLIARYDFVLQPRNPTH
jgi:hydroxyquinol 1,2-dioxygenase